MAMKEIYGQFRQGKTGEGALLIHKRGHDGKDFVCLRGLLEGCEGAYNCEQMFAKDDGCFCLQDGQSSMGKIIEEEKHRRLVERNASGAYSSLQRIVFAYRK
jgi:hypothetical protein